MTDHAHEDHASHGAVYIRVFAALCVFTVISYLADWIGMPNKVMLGAIVLPVAVAKALCVMMYFMHLKFERNWKYLLLAPTLILAAALPVALRPDIGEQYYNTDVPQTRDYAEQQASHHTGSHH